MNTRSKYGSKHLDRIFIFVMRSYLRSGKSGLLSIEMPNDKQGEDNMLIDGFLEAAVDQIINGQPPETLGAILEAEYQLLLKQNILSADQILALHLIRIIVPPILQERKLEVLSHYTNLLQDDANIYAQWTFYPNLSEQEREVLHVRLNVDYISPPPQELWRLNDF